MRPRGVNGCKADPQASQCLLTWALNRILLSVLWGLTPNPSRVLQCRTSALARSSAFIPVPADFTIYTSTRTSLRIAQFPSYGEPYAAAGFSSIIAADNQPVYDYKNLDESWNGFPTA